MNEEYIIYYLLFCGLNQENVNLKEENKVLTQELMETNSGVLALLQELEKSNDELLLNDKEKTEFLEKLKKLNKEQLERIKAQEDALIQADKMASLGHLVAGVAHEINNPTTYIRANIELLRKYWKRITENTNILEDEHLNTYTANYEEILESMYKGTDRIIEVVNGLKFFARQRKLEYEVFDLYKCISEAYKLVKNEFIRNKINYVNNYQENQYFIRGSCQQIEQIFVNLFMNSLTAIKDLDSIYNRRVEVGVRRYEDSKLIIIIKDNGCGISEENIKKIFDPFFTTHQASGGTGLGLSIVYGIINEHGGNIEVRSKVNEGTEFILYLPEYQIKIDN